MQERLDWTLQACARILRPLARLALSMGVKYPQLQELMRQVMVDEALRLWPARDGRGPNISQVAVTTGIHRKDVTERVRQARPPLPRTEDSAAARTFTLWLQRCHDDPAQRRLPLQAGDDGRPAFERVAHEATRGNVHHRVVLAELLRLGLVRQSDDGTVELLAQGFVPSRDLAGMLAFLGDNVRDHLLAAVANTEGRETPFLERAVFVDGLKPEACERVHQEVRRAWSGLHHGLVQGMTEALAEEQAQPRPGERQRMRVGVYVYFEDDAPPPPAGASGEEGTTT